MHRSWHRRSPTTVLLAATVTAAAVLGGTPSARAATAPQEVPADKATYDPYFAEQWALQAMKVPEAWARSTGAGVRIGVVDTGVDLGHEDLAGKVVASTSCVGAANLASGCTGSAQDDQGHGTHVAGIAAADTFNGKGVASVAPGALLVVVKALSANGSGALDDVNAGIKWAVDHGARIVNLSLESDGTELSVSPGQSLADGVEYAWRHGAIPVVAAGNATPSLFGSTGYAGIDAVVVGATGRSGQLAWYSSPLTGAMWGVVAPGGDARGPDGSANCAGSLAAGCIVSTGWFGGHTNAYADDEGTSMAAPEVAGVLALLLAEGLSPEAAINRLLSSADPVACGTDCRGAVNAAAAVGAAAPSSPATTTSPSGPTTTIRPHPEVATASASAVTAAPPTTIASHPPSASIMASRPPRPPTSRLAAGPPIKARGRRQISAAAVAVAILLILVVGWETWVVGVRRRAY